VMRCGGGTTFSSAIFLTSLILVVVPLRRLFFLPALLGLLHFVLPLYNTIFYTVLQGLSV
jgi:hypothetical protein